jgi:chromosome partitioning protein
VAVIALKGGSGKTTVAAHLALAAHLRGVPTLLADTDPQQSSHHVLGAREAPGPACVATQSSKLLSAQFAAAGLHKELLIVDTPAGAVEDLGEALALSDLAIMVVRPTLLDLAGLARTLSIVRRLKKPAMVVLNQAPVAREAIEPPLVQRALRALAYMEAPLAPVILRSRSIYQTALERGRSAEEMSDRAAAREIAALWAFVEAQVFVDPGETEPAA